MNYMHHFCEHTVDVEKTIPNNIHFIKRNPKERTPFLWNL